MKEFKLQTAKQLAHMAELGKSIKNLNNEEFEAEVLKRAKDKAVREEVQSHEKFVKGQEWYLQTAIDILDKDKFVQFYNNSIKNLELEATAESMNCKELYDFLVLQAETVATETEPTVA